MNATRHPLRRLALPALATLAFLSALPAHAVGRLADIQIIDRDSGETLPVHQHRGEYWVAGRPGARYAVSVRNALSGRVMSVVSVDGVNVVSGETAALEQTGYVLSPWQRYDITGWRKSDAEVAAFHFTNLSGSYAARTGRPAHVGVIGVAVFREKLAPPPASVPLPEAPSTWRERRELNESERSTLDRSAPASAAPAAESPASGMGSAKSQSHNEAADAVRRPASPAPRLGTGHGEREGSWVGHTSFERRSARPDEVIRIRYDSRINLIAMGVLPPDVEPMAQPQPFPGSRRTRYAPDPG
ncbi:MAG: hypothetical protein IV088_06430 [Hydrogenophaga sp.]|uniref:hypothetical protein n=1 Tax=Hydrogenophaga sp. TaxID=1904254 RepID=UPI0025BD16A8|nr:hypothetical protein [Hydrogenophaga sp.]MBT9550465.1 hypothetical protein [Hydrogenophaga sp.]